MRSRSSTIRAPRTLAIRHDDLPPLTAEEILVRVEHSGVCGSDLHFFAAGAPTPGTPFGHEITGQVVDAGSAHRDLLDTRVVVNPYRFCGDCRQCDRNRPINCVNRLPSFDAGFATHARVHVAPQRANVFAVPSQLPSTVAALAEPTAVALHAAERALAHLEPSPEDARDSAAPPLLILGAGPIGLLLTAYLVHGRGQRVWVLDRAASRCELASSVGAQRAFGTEEELSAALAGLPDQDAPIVNSGPLPPVPVVFECSGAAALLSKAAHGWVGRGGVLCQVAVFGSDPVVPVDSLLRKEADLVTSYAYTTEDWLPVLDFLSTHVEVVSALVAEFDGLDGLESLLTDTLAGRVAQKPVVRVAPAS